MDDNTLKVHVERRGNRYIWELHRDGVTEPIKYSVPIYSSADAARASGEEVRQEHLARLAARSAKRRPDGAEREAEPSAEVPHE